MRGVGQGRVFKDPTLFQTLGRSVYVRPVVAAAAAAAAAVEIKQEPVEIKPENLPRPVPDLDASGNLNEEAPRKRHRHEISSTTQNQCTTHVGQYAVDKLLQTRSAADGRPAQVLVQWAPTWEPLESIRAQVPALFGALVAATFWGDCVGVHSRSQQPLAGFDGGECDDSLDSDGLPQRSS